LPNSVNTDFQQLKATAVSSGGGSNAGAVTRHFDPPLLRGQLLEVIVAKTLTDGVWLESRNILFRANLPVGGLREGERLLLKVLDPDSSPPKLKLITDAELPNSSLAGVSTFLRSLLFRHQQLHPTQQFLTSLLSKGLVDKVGEVELNGLYQWLMDFRKTPERVHAAWVKERLQLSGLFRESSVTNSSDPQQDLKTFLINLLKLDKGIDKATVQAAIDGISSSQVKALDGLIQNNLQYSFLLPFLGEGWLEARISRDEEHISREQWQIYLRHQSQQMGDFSAEILLYKKTVSILFQSDQLWMIDLIKENYSELEQGIAAIGLSVQQISVAPMVSQKPNFYEQHEQQAIFDLRV
jgi:hypothetical protein